MKTIYIYSGGKEIYFDGISEYPSQDDIVIAADSGYETAIAQNVQPHILLGDLDSLKPELKKQITEKKEGNFKLIEVPAIKDDTDTMISINYALNLGCDKIIIIGGLGGRADHTFSNVYMLEYMHSKGVSAIITNGKNRIRFLKNSSESIKKSNFKYLSIIALDEECTGIEVKGCFYPLENATLKRSFPYAVSNEIIDDYAKISVNKGNLLIIESND